MANHLLALEKGPCWERPHLTSPSLPTAWTKSPDSQWGAFHPQGHLQAFLHPQGGASPTSRLRLIHLPLAHPSGHFAEAEEAMIREQELVPLLPVPSPRGWPNACGLAVVGKTA